ncbi:Lst4 [Kluyveromyces lactis]|nr:Lst4 [Kluyveromyces lactis]
MLGRLLRTSSLSEFVPFGSSNVTVGEEVFQNEPFYMTDDLKTLLYGTRDKALFERIANDRLHNGGFRLIISQELGHVTSRNNYQVVLDHSSVNFHTGAHIPLNELKDYIFGSSIRTIDYSASSDKIKVVKSANIVLFTRIFYLNEKSTLRIAISCCVTDDVLPVLTECWPHISSFLDQCENALLKYLAKNDTQFLPHDWKSRNCIEVGAVLQTFQRKIIPLLSGYSDTPRLFLYPMDSIPYIKTWVKYVTNWIELKDGPRVRFLPILLAKLRYDFASLLKENSNTRIVILTGNMNVSNRLIFILTAFLGPHFRGTLHKTINSQGCPSPAGRKMSNMSGASDFPFELKPSNSSITETNKGWEIPRIKRDPTFSITSVSSDETGVQTFIQPSSLKSGASSVQYLSSSLNSAYGSYGSWFKKVAQSPSSRSNESSHEVPPILHRNSSSTSFHQQAVLGNTNGSQRVTPQPSPTIAEYDEYPWFTPSPIARDQPRPEKRIPTPISSYTTEKDRRTHLQSEIYDVDMKRTVNRLIDEDSLNDAFADLVIDPPSYDTTVPNEKHGEIVEVNMASPRKQCNNQNQELLRRFTSYTPHYNQWFQLQACQITTESENKVIHSMKRDLTYADQNPCKKDKSTSTLLISLRSREIKQVTIVRDTNNRFIQRTKKILQNGKVGPVSRAMLSSIETTDKHLKKLMECNNDNEALVSLFNDIVTCTSP